MLNCDLSVCVIEYIRPFLHVVVLLHFSVMNVFNFTANQLNDVEFLRNNYTNN